MGSDKFSSGVVPASSVDASGRVGGREGESVVICAALKKDVLGEKNSNRGEKGKEVHYLSIY